MANRNTKFRRQILRKEALAMRKAGGTFSGGVADALERGSARLPVEMQFTSKWESNSSYRLFGV